MEEHEVEKDLVNYRPPIEFVEISKPKLDEVRLDAHRMFVDYNQKKRTVVLRYKDKYNKITEYDDPTLLFQLLVDGKKDGIFRFDQLTRNYSFNRFRKKLPFLEEESRRKDFLKQVYDRNKLYDIVSTWAIKCFPI